MSNKIAVPGVEGNARVYRQLGVGEGETISFFTDLGRYDVRINGKGGLDIYTAANPLVARDQIEIKSLASNKLILSMEVT